MSSEQVDLKRKGTMECTAQEGIQYLKDNKKDRLLAMQGLDEPPVKLQKVSTVVNDQTEEVDDSTSNLTPDAMKRTKTMEATLAEANYLLKDMEQEEGRSLRVRAEKTSEKTTKSPANDTTPKMARINTMKDTAQTAQHFLGSEGRGDTRSQTRLSKQLNDSTQSSEYLSSDDEDSDDKSSMKRTKTMADTTAAAGYFLGSESYGSRRSATKLENESKQESAISLKRTGTIAETATTAKSYLKDENLQESRSQSKALQESEKAKEADV